MQTNRGHYCNAGVSVLTSLRENHNLVQRQKSKDFKFLTQ